jgi:hypothetical protein
MGIFDWLLGQRRNLGRIYCGHGISPTHARATEDAIAENRYSVYASTADRTRAILILATAPPLVAKISQSPSFSGGAPDIIVGAVYEPKGDPLVLAQELELD